MNQRKCRNVGLRAFILAYDNILRIMSNNWTMVEYWEVDILLGALPRDMRITLVGNLQLDPRDHLIISTDTLQKHVLHKRATTHTLALLDWESVHAVVGLYPDSVPAGDPLT